MGYSNVKCFTSNGETCVSRDEHPKPQTKLELTRMVEAKNPTAVSSNLNRKPELLRGFCNMCPNYISANRIYKQNSETLYVYYIYLINNTTKLVYAHEICIISISEHITLIY